MNEATGAAVTEAVADDAVVGGEAVGEAELAVFHRIVGRLRALPVDDPVRLRAEQVAASFARDGRLRRRKARGAEASAADAAAMAATATGALERREDAPLAGPGAPGVFRKPRTCYVCKAPYRRVDSFYHLLCPRCAADNTARRALSTDLSGRRVLLTGGRVKIGFQLALMMLRDGAELLVTSRFPHDTVRRFRAAPGSARWLDRLTVLAVDLRDPRQVLGLCEDLRQQDRPLDILVNNAAQTVRRPPESYALLAAGEHDTLPPGARQAPGFTPIGSLPGSATSLPVALREADEAGLLPDPSPENSWSARLGTLDPAEVLETQLVNALAPALLCDRLLPLLLASPHPRRYVVNVTAVEGRFAVRNKTAGHPHTNMAKAALNMLTRTSAAELAERGVHMCAVDTGWITDENPAPKKARMADAGFRTPLDVVDGAARVYDPIVRGEAGDPVSGVFLKDYREAEW
ncbi:NAD(P)-dependent dehydrogenase (short-subunit alcohol dehydrogenase family) [Streptomyces griseochromogenes]|uniref:NAD(P)-dependent dehydrogenase (Short-subunit alcohol dehydrogenase family) n=1 Tax=Streptomyces griseochromogenes TaxID=68214 RepID=A0A1B1AVX2_9ACTN|nr:SDR family oxidoreductase [Streptomyces griseochromogenes]ANP50738.1 short-chain dehydrogenase [Streptomyces griseochromogenes]MBP2051539.1 NAD(P)-dependent dehydrogenase (short-subunit alcohol dehydrogenase family) [Streptomyces griseochromogenes]